MKFIDGFDPLKIKDKLIITEINPDISNLTDNQKKLIDLLIQCARVLDDIYYLQKYPDNLKLREEILQTNNPAFILFYKVMAGPYNHFDNDIPFIEGINNSDMAGFYPIDLTLSEWNDLIKTVPELIDSYQSPYTIISRMNDKLYPIPYCEYYKDYLTKAAKFLYSSLDYTDDYSLKSYISAQSNAFITNDYNEADIRWLQLNNNDLIPLLGAYEFYDDKFLGYKASFTAFIGIKNKEEFKKVELISSLIDLMQERLPVPDHYHKQKRGSLSNVDVVDIIFMSGDARCPIPTAAFNLPNSQKIRAEFGSKKILLYNIMKNKFDSVMVPISKILLDENDQAKISFESYFNYILLHEISHELGIGLLKDKDGKMKEVSYYLKDLYTVIEEAKADVMALFSLIFLLKQSYIIDCTYTNICLTYLINLFRFLRYGKENAHGLSSLIQLNFLRDEDIIILTEDSKNILFDFHKFEKSIEKLLTFLLTFQGEGDYVKTKNFIDKHSNINTELQIYLDKIKNLPIDILPWFPIAGETKPNF